MNIEGTCNGRVGNSKVIGAYIYIYFFKAMSEF